MKVLICKFGDWYAYVTDKDHLLIELGSKQKFESLSPKRVNNLISKLKNIKNRGFHIKTICGKNINIEILKMILKRYLSYISGEIKVENLYVLRNKTIGDLINELKPKPKKRTNVEMHLIEEEILEGAKDSPYFIENVVEPANQEFKNKKLKIKNDYNLCDIDTVGDDCTIDYTAIYEGKFLDLIEDEKI